MNKKNIPFSVLDLAVITEGHTPADAFKNSLDLAQKTEALGYKRFWLAEHHNMDSVASSATSVLIGYIAGGTSTIRVGSGGIMLPNHAPLIVAEQFGTLASLYPGRIDLGLGRAPGTDQVTAMALRRDAFGAANDFPNQVNELHTYFSSQNKTAKVRAIPGEGLDIPVWILGSSTDSAYLAAAHGLPYAFASHFAPGQLTSALKIYRDNFRPSAHLDKPYTMACVNIVAAGTDEEASYLATSFYQMFVGMVRNQRRPLPPPVKNMDAIWTEYEKATIAHMLSCSFAGSKETINTQVNEFITDTGVDELMVVAHVYDHNARIRSYEIIKEALFF